MVLESYGDAMGQKNWKVSPPKKKMEVTITMATVDFPIYDTNAAENEWQEVSP